MAIASIGGIIFIAIILAIAQPTYYVLFYILIHTRFLGFFYLGSILIQGVSIGEFAINLVTLSVGFFKLKGWRKFDGSLYFLFLGISFFLMYGILWPVYNGYSTLMQSVIASKEFWNFAFLLYLVATRDHINLNSLIKMIIIIGVYLACIVIIGSFIGIGPPQYMESGDGGKHIRAFYPTIISLSLFLTVGEWVNIRSKKPMIYLLIIPVNIIGVLLSRHTALTMCTAAFTIVFFFFGVSRKRIISVLYFISFSLAIIIYTDAFYNPIIEFYDSISSGEDEALSSRDRYNEFRWEAINEKPYSGYGFIHKTSKINKKFRGRSESVRFMETLSVIDSGYVDLLGRFGYILTAAYLILFGFVILKPLLKFKKFDVMTIGMSAFISQYYLINYTWSVFSFAHGIMPLCLSLYLLIYYEKMKNIPAKFNRKKMFV